MVVECSMIAALISGDILQALWGINIDKKRGLRNLADFKPCIYLDLVPHLVPLYHTIVSDPFVKNDIWLILAATLVCSSDDP